jgi:type I restriction enzyme S subunit
MSENNAIPNGFKMTELGPLPEEWKEVSLGELYEKKLIRIQNGFPCGNWNDRGIGIPHIRPFNVSDEGKIVFNNLKYVQIERNIERYILQRGDVIFNNTNSEELVGKKASWNNEGKYVLSNHMTIIRILNHSKINYVFLANYLHKKWFDGLYLGLCRRHVNQASISLARLKQIKIPLPPLSEQRAIANVLSTVQQAKEKTEAVISATKALKKSLMQHLFMYGPVPLAEAEQVPLKQTEIGEVPEEWEVEEIGYGIVNTQYGLSMRGNQEGKYPILRMNNLIDGRVGTLDLQYVDLDDGSF